MMTRIRNLFRIGEPFIWLTSTGLAVAVIMVVFLLSLIVTDGLAVFWPKRVALVEIGDGNAPPEQLLGEIRMQRDKATLGNADQPVREWQMFLGNRDVTGVSFRFFDESQVRKVSYPDDIIVIERMEYGNAIGTPVKLKLKQEIIEVARKDFWHRLDAALLQVLTTRTKVETIEKRDIGAINARMERLQLEVRGLGQAAKSAQEQMRLSSLQSDIQKLQEAYDVLAKNARELRTQLDGSALVLRLATGEEKEIPVAQLVSYLRPNQLGLTGRLERFFSNVWAFLTLDPREANTEGGIFPAIFGTFVMTLMMSLAVTPFGVLAAIYLREYARQGLFVRMVRIAVNNLAGVPSIVFGIFGVGFFVYFLGSWIDHWFFSEWLPTPTFGTGGVLWAALTLALLTVPVVIVSTEEALAAVPRGMREGSLACGASKWQTIKRIVLPASAPGILTGLILAMARGAGEVAPLMLVGVVKLAPSLPIDGNFPYVHLEQKFMHLGFHIYDLGFQSPDSEAAKPMVFATTLFLIVLVVALNLTAIIVRERLKRRYSTGAF